MRLSTKFVPILLMAGCLFGQESTEKLPVKRVVLYKNGVGYFEHLGQIQGNQVLPISFTSGQLNDVLKSLTVLDLSGGRVTGVSYGSTAPADRQLGALRLPIGEKTTLAEFLGGMRGTRLEVRSGTHVIAGRLLSVERKTRISGGTTLEVDYISVITDTGDVRTTELSPSFSVRLLERGLPGKIDSALDLLSQARQSGVRRMLISTEGSGERSLFLSYISEVPVWKTTYRIVMNSKPGQSPLLQGWAIVDNTVGQDWENVELSLVAGAPQSFVQKLSQPLYSRRPLVPLPESLQISPQSHEATLTTGGARLTGTVTDPAGFVVAGATVKAYDAAGALVGETTTNPSGQYEFVSLPEGTLRLQVSLMGFRTSEITGVVVSSAQSVRQDARLQVGALTETVTVTAAPSSTQTQAADSFGRNSRSAGSGAALGRGSALGGTGTGAGFRPGSGGNTGGSVFKLDDARSSLEVAARAQELGDLFEYRVKQPITIRQNQSALVPIVQSPITSEKISIWNEQRGLPRPQRALWLTNSTGLTLDGGSFSVLEQEAFAGEGIFEPIRPGEKRIVSYALDLAVNASSRDTTQHQRIARVRVSRGILTHESEVRENKTYTFRNEDAAPRTVIVEHPVRSGYDLRGDVRPIETSAGWMRFRISVDPKQTTTLLVQEARPTQATYMLTNITSDQVALFVGQQSIDKAIEEALRRVLAQKNVVAILNEKIRARQEELDKIFDDQQRLRENLKALKGSAEEKALVQRYTQQLNEQENRLEALQKEQKQLEAELSTAQEALNRTILELSFDVKL